jgi:hypothetical protein
VNFRPSSIALLSLPSIVVGAEKSKIVLCGVTVPEASESGLEPTPLFALTLNVYPVPFVRPVTVAVVADGPAVTGVCATPPAYGVTV